MTEFWVNYFFKTVFNVLFISPQSWWSMGKYPSRSRSARCMLVFWQWETHCRLLRNICFGCPL